MQLVSKQAHDYYDLPKKEYIRVLNAALKYLRKTYGQDPLTTYDSVIKAIRSLLDKINQNTSGRLYVSKTSYDLYRKATYVFVEYKSEISPTIEHDKSKLLEYAKSYKYCYYHNDKDRAKRIDHIVNDIDKVDGLSGDTWKKISKCLRNMSITISTSFGRDSLDDEQINSNFQAIRKIIDPVVVSKNEIIQYVYDAYHGFISYNKSAINKVISKVSDLDAVDGLTDKEFSEVRSQFNSFTPDIDFDEFLGLESISGKFLKESIEKLSKLLDTNFTFTKIQDPKVIVKLAAYVNDLILDFVPRRNSKIEKIRLKLFFVNHVNGVSDKNLKHIKSAFEYFDYLSNCPNETSLNLASHDKFSSVVKSIDNYVGIQYQTTEMKKRAQMVKIRRQKIHNINVRNHRKEVLTSHSSGCFFSAAMLFLGIFFLAKSPYSGSALSWIGGILFIGSLIFAFYNTDV